jgi:hypothetical protein
MTIAMQPIYTQTVGAGGASSITFNNIPQTFTDLKLSISMRGLDSALTEPWVRFNGDSATNYSFTRIYGNGSSTSTDRGTSNTVMVILASPGTSYTASTFGSGDLYIPNYVKSNFKSVISDTVTENNATLSFAMLFAGLWRNTSAITSITVGPNGTGFAQHSTFTLYGITKG